MHGEMLGLGVAGPTVVECPLTITARAVTTRRVLENMTGMNCFANAIKLGKMAFVKALLYPFHSVHDALSGTLLQTRLMAVAQLIRTGWSHWRIH